MEGLEGIDFKEYNVLKNKRILVTGHTGFKGSWLTMWLHLIGADVIGYSLDPKNKNDNFVLTNIGSKITDLRGDVRNYDAVEDIIKTYRPEIVFHLAAQPLVRQSYLSPKYTYEVNVMGTLNILEAIRVTDSVRAGIMITSDKCYENKEQIWSYRETDPLGGFDPYSSSKGSAEILIQSYRNSYFHPDKYHEHMVSIASARAGNVIGGGDWSEDRLIPDCIKSVMNKQNLIIRNPRAIRPWQHVIEPIAGYLQLAVKLLLNGPKYAESWNFGPNEGNERSVEWIVQQLIERLGNHISYSMENNEIFHEATQLKLDSTKAKLNLGWNPKWEISTSLNKTIEWFNVYQEQGDVYELCKKQIIEYSFLQ